MRGDGSRVEHESSPLNEQGLTSAASLGDVSTGAIGHLQSGKDLKGKKERKDPSNSHFHKHTFISRV